MEEIVLKTGKKIGIRQKNGQYHFIESRLTAACSPRMRNEEDMGVNFGDMLIATEISAICSIESIDGEKIRMPMDLKDVFELMNRFTYEEWTLFKTALNSEQKEAIEEAAKNLQASIGSATE